MATVRLIMGVAVMLLGVSATQAAWAEGPATGNAADATGITVNSDDVRQAETSERGSDAPSADDLEAKRFDDPTLYSRDHTRCDGMGRRSGDSCALDLAGSDVRRSYFPIMTSDDLITAHALSPTFRSWSSTASLVTDEIIVSPGSSSTLMCAVVAPLVTAMMRPGRTLRALSFMEGPLSMRNVGQYCCGHRVSQSSADISRKRPRTGYPWFGLGRSVA
jgi:hypothetical protein